MVEVKEVEVAKMKLLLMKRPAYCYRALYSITKEYDARYPIAMIVFDREEPDRAFFVRVPRTTILVEDCFNWGLPKLTRGAVIKWL